MSNLLIVLAANADDAPQAERLLDFIYQLGGKGKRGHILLALAHDVHAEMRTKLSISADLGFAGVSVFQAKPPQKGQAATKVECINDIFHQVGHHISTRYRWPWLWLEPDATPLRPDWREKLADAYAGQPKKYMGRGMKRKEGEAEHLFLARTAIYPAGAWNELRLFNSARPFEWDAGAHITARCTKTKLIQQASYEGDISIVNQDAVLFHSDKSGALMEHLRLNKPLEPSNGEVVPVKMVDTEAEQKVIQQEIVKLREAGLEFVAAGHTGDPEPPDKRTKAWKEWKVRNQ